MITSLPFVLTLFFINNEQTGRNVSPLSHKIDQVFLTRTSDCWLPPIEHGNSSNCWTAPHTLESKKSNLWTQNKQQQKSDIDRSVRNEVL